jgi:hypothetical protein
MAIAGSCVSTMEKPCSWIAMPPESATCLHTQNPRKGHTGHLASLTSHRCGQYGLLIRHGQRHCSTWAERSRMSSLPLGPCGLATGKSLGCDAGAIPGLDRSAALLTLIRWNAASHSRFVLGWVCPTSAILRIIWHPISGIAKTSFVCHSPHLPSAHEYPSFRVHFTRRDGCSPLRVVQPQNTLP